MVPRSYPGGLYRSTMAQKGPWSFQSPGRPPQSAYWVHLLPPVFSWSYLLSFWPISPQLVFSVSVSPPQGQNREHLFSYWIHQVKTSSLGHTFAFAVSHGEATLISWNHQGFSGRFPIRSGAFSWVLSLFHWIPCLLTARFLLQFPLFWHHAGPLDSGVLFRAEIFFPQGDHSFH